jgi:predicted Zn-dependent protease
MSSRGLVAHADFPPGYSLIVPGEPLPLHFNESEKWSLEPVIAEYDVETVALHEIGHCLGLPHSASPHSVMYSAMRANFASRQLSQEDVEAFKFLYPAK